MVRARMMLLVAGLWALPGAAHQSSPAAVLSPDQQNALSKLQQKYSDEHNPVHKAKILVRLGELQVASAAARSSADDYAAALEKLQQYRGEIEITHSALLGTGVNPALRPDGFNQLQMSLRENLRYIQDMVFAMPASRRSAFIDVQQDLEAQNQKMLDELFIHLERPPAKPPAHP